MRSTRLLRLLIAAALLPLAGCPEEKEILTHGIVKLEMRRSQNQASNPYLGTARVLITMTYQECLSDLYEANPDLRQNGREGEAIFGGYDKEGEGWSDRLCEPGTTSAQADCSIMSIVQQLSMVEQLTVEYGIAGELEGRVLPFGPLPTKETAGCLDPIVRIAIGGAKGYNGEGAEIWTGSANPPEAVTDQGGELVVEAARSDD